MIAALVALALLGQDREDRARFVASALSPVPAPLADHRFLTWRLYDAGGQAWTDTDPVALAAFVERRNATLHPVPVPSRGVADWLLHLLRHE